MDGFLNDVMEEDPGKDLYLLGADQSFEATVWSQMLQRPGHFCVFVTIACLLHIMMWLLCALWQLGRTTVLYGFVRKLNFDSLGDARLYQKFRTDDYNYYRSFTLKQCFQDAAEGFRPASQPADLRPGSQKNRFARNARLADVWACSYVSLQVHELSCRNQ